MEEKQLVTRMLQIHDALMPGWLEIFCCVIVMLMDSLLECLGTPRHCFCLVRRKYIFSLMADVTHLSVMDFYFMV